MLIISSFEITESGRRTQPWGKTVDAVRDGQYYDFKKNPELIETKIEDFAPYSEQPAVQVFYDIIRWINSEDSVLESTDCLLSGDPALANEAGLFSCSHIQTGRFEFFIRNYKINTMKDSVIWVFDQLSLYLQLEGAEFKKGMFRIQPLITDYIINAEEQLTGHRFCIQFYAYGNGLNDTWSSLACTFNNLFKALKRLNSDMISGRPEPLFKNV
ncbi:hypothetical protein MNY64_05165 [Moellerella wisconsensis]|uniref:hypothetical protein n=1 Tax=Moellerella wisconsensis TaxID=158849 RepID=UPI001F4E8E74|nr:hypothetical protein [Moellerella wisconsensis]UNH28200.1 hypothetical protein MNY64_05165 [Moellerella wisconsensis]